MTEDAKLPLPTGMQKVFAFVVVFLPLASLAYALVFDLNSSHLWLSLIVLGVLYVATEFGVEAGFHRFATHRAFEAHTSIKIPLIILGSMAAQGPLLAWAANHRRHHRFSDVEGDPHSPAQSLFHAHLGWHFSVGQSSVIRFAPDLLIDRTLMRLNRWYWWWVALGLFIPAAFVGAMTASWDGAFSGLLWGGLVRICLTQNFTWSVNSICHRFGSRPFDIPGTSRNNFWLAIPTMGQSWHNNHHAYPQAALLDFKWWQLDPSAYFLRLFKMLGLISYK